MLRVSSQYDGSELNLAAVGGDAISAAHVVPLGLELIQFAEAAARHDNRALDAARRQLVELAGELVLVDAAAVAANFQRMVRIADATGIPADDITTELSREIRDALGLSTYASARNTPGAEG